MSEHKAIIDWTRGTAPYTYESYPRDHVWRFDCGTEIKASATPAYLGNADLIDPEEAFVASLSSCHLLTFLAIAAKKGFTVNAYRDEAVGTMGKDADGHMAITKVVLHPVISFEPDAVPGPDELAKMHDNAHKHCFIANSVKTEVTVDLAMSTVT